MSEKREVSDSVNVLDVLSYASYHIDDFIEMINNYREKIEEEYDIVDGIRISLETSTYDDAPILVLYFSRLETDFEYEQRLKSEEDNKKRKAAKKKEEAEKEYELFLKLKKKYECSE